MLISDLFPLTAAPALRVRRALVIHGNVNTISGLEETSGHHKGTHLKGRMILRNRREKYQHFTKDVDMAGLQLSCAVQGIL